MTRKPLPFTAIVNSLPSSTPFVGPEALERQRGAPFKVRIGANESAFGVSPKARAAMAAAIDRVSWYGDPENFELRAALAQHHGVTMDQICVAGGIDELLGLVVRMTALPGTPIVTSLGGYPTFNYHVDGFGGRLQRVPYRDDHNDLQALLDKVHEVDAALVYLANPDNPMGTWHEANAIGDFINQLPATTLLILDEAYIEFAPGAVLLPIDTSDRRVIRMRTFSKAHGMAGARIGYAIAAPEVITSCNKIRNQFGVNRIAQIGALASLRDDVFSAGVVAEVARGRQDYYSLADELGMQAIPSATNFVTIDCGRDGDYARNLLRALGERGVFVRMPGVAPLDRCIRVTVGSAPERALFGEIFRSVVKSASAQIK